MILFLVLVPVISVLYFNRRKAFNTAFVRLLSWLLILSDSSKIKTAFWQIDFTYRLMNLWYLHIIFKVIITNWPSLIFWISARLSIITKSIPYWSNTSCQLFLIEIAVLTINTFFTWSCCKRYLPIAIPANVLPLPCSHCMKLYGFWINRFRSAFWASFSFIVLSSSVNVNSSSHFAIFLFGCISENGIFWISYIFRFLFTILSIHFDWKCPIEKPCNTTSFIDVKSPLYSNV